MSGQVTAWCCGVDGCEVAKVSGKELGQHPNALAEVGGQPHEQVLVLSVALRACQCSITLKVTALGVVATEKTCVLQATLDQLR
jgi:hypothetical protein